MSRRKKSLITPISKRKSIFQPPGTITYVGKERFEDVGSETILYNKQKVEQKNGLVFEQLKQDQVNWYNIDGVHDEVMLEKIGSKFHFHHLLMEDIANTTQRPKMEVFDNCIYQCIKMISYDLANHEIIEEQVSILLTNDAVITFQEKTGDVFEDIRKRITEDRGRIRDMKNDYLFYSLIDSIIDHYFLAIETIGEYLNELEDDIFENPKRELLIKVQQNKRNLMQLRRAIYPLRECINRIIKENSALIEPQNIAYFHDAYDHCIQISDTVDSYRELNAGLRDMYLSSVSHKMNQIMQVLTVMSSIFIPLTFIAGIYGMNFDNIPELHWQLGYRYFWILCGIIFVSLLGYFKYKKWL